MKNDDELMLVDKYAAKPLLYFFLFILVLIISSIVYFCSTDDRRHDHITLILEKHARVIKIAPFPSQPRDLAVYWNDGKTSIWTFNLKVGDSVSKYKGDYILYIFRKDSIIPISLPSQEKWTVNSLF
ncbi:hypothetical protein HZQ28_15080 [Elizabethkingia anophelis]|nr:hypothetical protein [Elizabethkingia anophelis]MCT3995818.1 hypothetical protein [Elizabethkingia anophelis]MCT3999474.1 hypothetical protein [Elizabethkingia anophelis]MCT4256652.1 hypothetical protein [Elizabethkingia anophelis]